MTKVCTTSYDVAKRTRAVHFVDGVSRVYGLAGLPEPIVIELALLGLKNKVVDSFAGRGAEGPAACRAAADTVYANLVAGEWDARGAANGGIWPAAVARAFGLDGDATAKAWATMTEEKRVQVRANAKVKKAKLEIEAERLGAVTEEDASQILEDFGVKAE